MSNINNRTDNRLVNVKKAGDNHILGLRSRGEKIVFIIIGIVFFIYAASFLYVFVWAFLASLKENVEYITNPLALPQDWLFSNYIKAFQDLDVNGTNMIGMLGNSLWLTIGATFAMVFCCSFTGYIISKYSFPGRNVLYGIAIFIMIIPIVGSLPATYKLYADLGLINSPTILIAYTGGFGFSFLILHAYYKGISWTYAEAAFIDGASHAKVYFKIMIPMATPSLLAIGIISFIGLWNDYMTPILFLENYPTLASGLFEYQTKMVYKSNYPVYFAGIIMSMLPIILLYSFFQNTIMTNTVAGGLKG